MKARSASAFTSAALCSAHFFSTAERRRLQRSCSAATIESWLSKKCRCESNLWAAQPNSGGGGRERENGPSFQPIGVWLNALYRKGTAVGRALLAALSGAR